MQSHQEERHQDSEIGARATKVAEFVLAEFSDLDVQADLVLKILGILDVNSFEIPSPEATVQERIHFFDIQKLALGKTFFSINLKKKYFITLGSSNLV
jgi:hypothetical protein